MADKIFIVEGRQYRTESDYNRALHDNRIIEKIRAEIDINNPDELRQLVSDLRQGERYKFLTILGDDFLDEMEEKLRKSPVAGTASVKKGSAVKGKNPGMQRKRKSFDEAQMDEFVKLELLKQEKRRKLLLKVCSVVGAVCLTYFGYYAYEGYRTEQNFAQMAEIKEQTRKDIANGVYEEPTVQITYTQEKDAPEILDEYKKIFNMNNKK